MDKTKNLLDTNAYFHLLCFLANKSNFNQISQKEQNEINFILKSECYISKITEVEIISVIGKYSRGNSTQNNKCNCVISPNGQKCQNIRYSTLKKPWKTKEIKAWLKLTNDIISGKSNIIKISIETFNDETINFALQNIQYALKFKFASMDSLIIATAQQMQKRGIDINVITSDKSMKSAMDKLEVKYSDPFKSLKYINS